MAAVVDTLRSLLLPGRDRQGIPALDGAYSPNRALEGLETIPATIASPDDVCALDDAWLVASRNRLLRLSRDGTEPEMFAEFEAGITAMAALPEGRIAVGLHNAGVHCLDDAGRIVHSLERAAGKPLRCVTAIAAGPRGTVYVTVGTTEHGADDWVWDLMERNRCGQLLRWQPATGDCERLLDGLAYPNGIVLEAGGESLLLTLSWSHGLVRYRPAASAPDPRLETVIANMPGYPARIAPAGGGGYWLALFAMRTQLVEMVLREKAFKREMMRCVDPELWIRPALKSTGSHLEPLQGGGIKKLGIRKPWAPPRSYGLVLRLNDACEPIASLHSRVDGDRHGIMAAREIGGQLVIASKGGDRLLLADPGTVGDGP